MWLRKADGVHVSVPPFYIPSKNVLNAFDKKSFKEPFFFFFNHKWPVSLGTVGPYLPTCPARAHPVAQPTCRPPLAVRSNMLLPTSAYLRCLLWSIRGKVGNFAPFVSPEAQWQNSCSLSPVWSFLPPVLLFLLGGILDLYFSL